MYIGERQSEKDIVILVIYVVKIKQTNLRDHLGFYLGAQTLDL